MIISEYITTHHSITSMPLLELTDPNHRSTLLRFVAKQAPTCVAEALIARFVAQDMQRGGIDRKTARVELHRQTAEL